MEPEEKGRRQFVVMTASVIAAFTVIVALVFWPIFSSIVEKKRAIRSMEQQLRNAGFDEGFVPLRSMEISEKLAQAKAQEQWEKVRERLLPTSSYYLKSQDARVADYQSDVARERMYLQRQAAIAGLQIPRDLGMPDGVNVGDEAATLLMQLRIVSTIVQLAAQQRVGKIVSIEPLTPVAHNYKGTSGPYYKEFPVRVELETEMEPLLRFIHQASTNEHLLPLRGLRIEKKIPEDGSEVNEENPKLRAVVVLCALALLKDPGQIQTTPPAPKPVQPARGY